MTTIGHIPVGAAERIEVVAKAERRRFTAEYKRRILQEADWCREPGDVAALLRREGLYFSHLAAWRAARRRGELVGLAPKARGAEADPAGSSRPQDRRVGA